MSPLTSERALTTLGPSAMEVKVALFDGARRSSTLVAATSVIALEFGRAAFEHMVRSSYPVALHLQHHLFVATTRQLREADRRLAAVLAQGERGRRDLEYLHAATGEVDMSLDGIDRGDERLFAADARTDPSVAIQRTDPDAHSSG